MRASSPSPCAELREKLPCPQLSEFETLTSTYVDNVTVIGRNKAEVEKRCNEIAIAFSELDIPMVWSQDEPVDCLDSVGCVLDLKNRTLRNKNNRVWRTYLAGLELCKRSRYEFLTLKSGWVMQLACSDSVLACCRSLIRFIGFAGWKFRLECRFGLLFAKRSDEHATCYGLPELTLGANWYLRWTLGTQLTLDTR